MSLGSGSNSILPRARFVISATWSFRLLIQLSTYIPPCSYHPPAPQQANSFLIVRHARSPLKVTQHMPIPTPPTRLEETFQPILPKVDHILALMREHQARTSAGDDQGQGRGNGNGNGNLSGTEKRSGNGKDGDGDGGLVDLEDKIIKEVRPSSFPRGLSPILIV